MLYSHRFMLNNKFSCYLLDISENFWKIWHDLLMHDRTDNDTWWSLKKVVKQRYHCCIVETCNNCTICAFFTTKISLDLHHKQSWNFSIAFYNKNFHKINNCLSRKLFSPQNNIFSLFSVLMIFYPSFASK